MERCVLLRRGGLGYGRQVWVRFGKARSVLARSGMAGTARLVGVCFVRVLCGLAGKARYGKLWRGGVRYGELR